jgi:hypothetical protein
LQFGQSTFAAELLKLLLIKILIVKKNLLLFTLFSLLVFNAISQEQQEEAFKPNGKPIVTVFANVHTLIQDGTAQTGFQLTRGYLGYEYNFSKNFSGKIVFDIGNVGNVKYQMISFVKYAMMTYTYENLSINFGLIPTTEFTIQETFWGHRYVEKSFEDLYGFQPSADLGASATYKFNDIVTADLAVFNGEGYKLQQMDNYFKTAVGVTINPIKKLTVRLVFDIMGKDSAQITYGGFVGYKEEKFILGAEYNYQQNHTLAPGQNYYGISTYGTYFFTKKISVFARYDKLNSNVTEAETEPWNYLQDGQQIIGGFQYAPVKGIKISPNYRGWIPDDSSKSYSNAIFLNVEVKL